jgi:hypothetical protein
MRIPFELPHVFEPSTPRAENSIALAALQECLVTLNIAFLSAHRVSPIYRAGVVYGRTHEWDTVPAILARGFGDCKSLAPWLVAQYRMQGVEARPSFRYAKNPRSGYLDFHILVQTARGFEDPSKVLGMGADENQRF